MTTVELIRMFLVLAIVFFASFLFTDIIGAPIITVLVYFVWQYRRKIRSLESRLADATGHPTEPVPSGSESQLPPSSTDA